MSNLHEAQGYEIAVVGAGAAGLAAAITAAEQAKTTGPVRIVLLDGATTIGAKILVSGGGRCNVTHEEVAASDFFGNRHIIKNVLAAFTVDDTIAWFCSMGVKLKREDTGKLFPVTDKARTVLTALVERCRALDIVLQLNHRVMNIEPDGAPLHGFVIQHQHGLLRTGKVILATGGRSVPKSGSDGSGYEFARRLGHHVSATVPALVPLILDDAMFHKTLSGLSQEVALTTTVQDRKVDSRTGSLLWTHFGISGPVVMDASRFWCLAQERGEPVSVFCNFLPGRTQELVREWIIARQRDHPKRSLAKTWAELLPQRFAEAIMPHVGCEAQMPVAQLPRQHRDRLVEALVRFKLPITQHRGWNYAEVTAGGIPLEEVSFRTMESKIVPGLYLVGEVLDCDGRIGGFNFHWAWATGFLAGKATVESTPGSSQTSA